MESSADQAISNLADKPNIICQNCVMTERAFVFPFGFEDNHDLNNILSSDSMEIFDKLPNFEIKSRASEIGNLKKHDVDANTADNIDSRYFSVQEFQKLKRDNSFNLFHSNLNGLISKFDLVHNFINNTNLDLDIVAFSETTQKENEDFQSNVFLEGFHKPYATGSKSAKGGVAIYVKNDINSWEREDLNSSSESYEGVWIEIKRDKSKNIVCACTYRHPGTDSSEFTEYLNKNIRRINKENKECYILGDFNIDLLKYDSNNKSREFLNSLTSSGFLPNVLQPSRLSEFSSTLIDNIYSNRFESDSISGNVLIMFADHFSQFLSVNKPLYRPKPSTLYRYDYSKFNESSFVDDISIQRWKIIPQDANASLNDLL